MSETKTVAEVLEGAGVEIPDPEIDRNNGSAYYDAQFIHEDILNQTLKAEDICEVDVEDLLEELATDGKIWEIKHIDDLRNLLQKAQNCVKFKKGD